MNGDGRGLSEYLAQTLFLVHKIVRAVVLIEKHQLAAALDRLSNSRRLRRRAARADRREIHRVADRLRNILQIEGYVGLLHSSAALGADIERAFAGYHIFAPIALDVVRICLRISPIAACFCPDRRRSQAQNPSRA